ncbi:hypothetical protein EEB14_50900 [Rhodococcus sp. WS4]|nr:hypothetical protein EEB14_50900 [Rhodococcus sp. WS4]
MSPVCGGRQSSRRRSALLAVTVLAAIVAVLTALQIAHSDAAGDVPAPLPTLLGADAHPNIPASATADAADRGTEDPDPPTGGVRLQLTGLAGMLAVLVGVLSRRRTPHRIAHSRRQYSPVRARAPSSTSPVSPMPVRSSTCVMRV